VLESLEVTASAGTCIVHKGDDITIRDFVVHDCPGQGLLGNDSEAGSLTLEHSEFYANGNGTFEHQIYMATSEDMYPGSVFRLQHCYIHDGGGIQTPQARPRPPPQSRSQSRPECRMDLTRRNDRASGPELVPKPRSN
jgi:hypothetical protein